MVTLKEIAQRCNVSVATVSNILNGKPKVSEETKKLVLEVVAETGYHPNYVAQGLRRQKTHTIGIIADEISLFSTPKMIESIMEYSEKQGYRTVVQNLRLFGRWKDAWYNQDELYRSVLEPALNELRSIKVEGVIYVASHAHVIRCFPKDFPIPVVLAYAYMDSDKVPCVVIDDEKGSYDMTKYLISMGHRRIGIAGGLSDNIHTQKRLIGYQKALFEEGILYNPSWISYGTWDRRSGYEQTEKLLQQGITAIFCLADQIAGGVYDYLEEHNLKVGEDISVVGFDNQEISEYFRPALTTMNIPLLEIGKCAAQVLLNIVEGQELQSEQTREIQMPCQLIVRDSVCRLK